MNPTDFHAKIPLRWTMLCLWAMWSVFLDAPHAQIGTTAPPAQYSCGVLQKLGGLPDDYIGPVYYDRFGGAWTEGEIYNLNANVADECTAGVFHLDFSGSYTTAERDQVCAALTYLSGLVGAGASNGIVPLKIEFANDVNGGAVATQFMRLDDCNKMKNNVLLNIRTQANQLPIGLSAGIIRVNATINWHTGGMPTDLNDWNTNPNYVGKVDLYTAMLHEGLHILGMASTFGGVELQGGNIVQGYFTEWDGFLQQKNGANYVPFLQSANDPDCCSKREKNPAAPNSFTGTCGDDIVFRDGSTDFAEVSYVGLTPNNVGSTNNRLSHLDIGCGPGDQYVMHPAINASPANYSFPRRVLTQAEQDILCRIGYPAASSCQNCVVVTEDDVIQEYIFLNGGVGSIEVLLWGSAGILSNDITPANQIPPSYSIELCGHSPELTVTPVIVLQNGYPLINSYEITSSTTGSFEFCYKITSNCGRCDEAVVKINVLDAPLYLNCNPNDCNLICFGDMEDFPIGISAYYPSLGLPLYYFDDISDPTPNGNYDNSPDIYTIIDQIPQNKIVRWQRSDNPNVAQESLRVPLSQPIYEGCTSTIAYDAGLGKLVTFAVPANLRIEVYGLTGAPCTDIDQHPFWGAGAGTSFQLCPGITAYRLDTNDALPFNEYIQSSTNGLELINLELEPYTFTYTHPIGAAPITDLLIWGTYDAVPLFPPLPGNPIPELGANFYLDNITATSSCNAQVSVTTTVLQQCIGGQAIIEYTVCVSGPDPNPVDIKLEAQIPPGFEVVAGNGFDAAGVANLQLIPGGLCNKVVLTLNVSTAFSPVSIDVPMDIIGGGLCTDPAVGSDGTVTLMLQKCDPSAKNMFGFS
jgi:hypothetical protein